MFLTLNERIILMAEYREFICTRMGLGPRCGFEVRAETEAEVMKHAEMHVAEAHGMEGMSEKIKASIKSVKSETESALEENIHTTRQDFKFK
jgi:predicted small metal-binding protein